MEAILDTINNGIVVVSVNDIIEIDSKNGWFVVRCKNFYQYSCKHLRFK